MFITTKALMLASLAALVLAQGPDATISLYQDTACQTPVPGAGYTVVYPLSCDTGPFQTGWSSARIVNELTQGGTITFYTENECGCPTCGSHGYSASDNGCLTEFGFTANAVGFYV
ncbi:hypothetical protein M409DRAFT_21679 [Zasmidium cellare ATCC 36951]|uniref:Uncharacterized protein n=1 Tax=Zasmidium cellare ATCC 36951 TaxID=1080233 RepID=A0A6A6CMH3_ZASCE|nr:uncharacterized protein M409DRAFT_21679 [Zasmidium cellare ATCC 36951]KAF2168241.1 hypothetical protein M409DRAFT_21679 [Zasmidium cellare ATCC 36951]